MRPLKAFLPLLATVLCLCTTACTHTTISNLTPSTQARNPNGLYNIEISWSSNQQSLRKDTLQPVVVIGMQTYPMQPVPLVRNRWETLVPVPADSDILHYRIKFDFEYNSVPVRRSSSKLSDPYQLKIADQ